MWEGVHKPVADKSLGETTYVMLLEAMASTRHAVYDLCNLSKLSFAGMKGVGGFVAFLDVEAEDVDISGTGVMWMRSRSA